MHTIGICGVGKMGAAAAVCFKRSGYRVMAWDHDPAQLNALKPTEAISLVEKGIAIPEDVDLVARLTFGLRMPVVGPLENMDLVGLDLIEKIHQYLLADLAHNHGPSEYLTDRVRQGHLGVKSGQGFYDWRSRKAKELIQRRDKQIIHQLNYLHQHEDNQQDESANPTERPP
jgi:3-hydroxyacyl-CoA dehydrogenase